MRPSTGQHVGVTTKVLRAFAGLSIIGLAGLVLTAVLGFEEPNATLLLLSSILLSAAPVAVLVHVSVTRELTRQEKRIWIQHLTGRRAAWAFAEYLTCPDRRATAGRLAAETRRG